MKNDLKSAIRNIYADRSVTPKNSDGMKQTILEARRIMQQADNSYESISFWQFFWSQLSFIRKRVWGIQFLTLILCVLKLLAGSEMINTVGLLSAILPLIFLAGTGELSRAFVYGTEEMELSTCYTFHQVMLTRITLLGLTDVLFLTLMGMAAAYVLPVNTLFLFMYLCVPFFITAFGCIYILNHYRSKECHYYCAVWGVVVMITAFCLSKIPVLYEAALIWCWMGLFALSIFGVVIEGKRLLIICSKKLDTIKIVTF